MRKVVIKVLRRSSYDDLIDKYENKIDLPCIMKIGDEFISVEAKIPDGFCNSAWISLYPYVFALANSCKNLHDNWMKNPNQAIVSCNDGLRPVSFLLEAIDE